jgi:hypothetical protein
MTSTQEYSKIFDSGIDFAVNAINEHCNTNFKTLEEAITAIQAMKKEAGSRAAMFNKDEYCLGDERFYAND